jgi:hypothetical protein
LAKRIRATRGQPRNNLQASATWGLGQRSIFARAVRCGDYEAAALTNLAPAQVAPSPANSKLRTLPTDAVASRR